MNALTFNWSPAPSAKTLRRFLASDAFVRCVMGPVGSGKTTACLADMLSRAIRQMPGVDGVRRSKFAVIRDTYRQLNRTTIPSWHKIMPKHIGKWTGGGAEPAQHEILIDVPDVGRVHMIVLFVAIGDQNAEDVLRGLELTGAYLNEADRLAREVLTFLLGRVGRYPSEAECAWSGIWLDCNAPDIDNYVYELFVEALPEGWAFFRQPSGFSPQAENIEFLPRDYYERQAQGQPDWYVRRMLRNEFGFSRDGDPVYPEYRDDVHCSAADILANPRWPLIIGLDAGRTPGAILMQEDMEGQIRVIDELAGENVGAASFARAIREVLARDYPGCTDIRGVGDPSAAYAGDQAEESWLEIVEAVGEFPVVPAPTNAVTERLEAVRQPLLRPIHADKPGLIISPRCKVLRRGFNSGYIYAEHDQSGDYRPLKNKFSHVHDGLQYGCLDIRGLAANRGRARRARKGRFIEETYDAA